MRLGFRRSKAKLRRGKIAERWIVFTVVLMFAITMLPVLVVVGGIMMAGALWRRYMQSRQRQGISLTADGPRTFADVSCHRGPNDVAGIATPDLRTSLSQRPAQRELQSKELLTMK